MVKFTDSKGGAVTKPSIVRDYNHTMGGVDESDQVLANYPVSRKRQKIYYKSFHYFVRQATFNLFGFYQKDGGKTSPLEYPLAGLKISL